MVFEAQNISVNSDIEDLKKTVQIADSLFSNNNLALSESILHQVLHRFANDSNVTKEFHFKTYNLLGLINTRLQKLDSSNYYYAEALRFLNQSPQGNLEKKYTRGITKNSIALNQFNTGKTEKAIASLHEAIGHLQDYSSEITDEAEKLKSTKKRLACIDNLAGFYRGVGDNERAIDLATFAYTEKQKILPRNDNGLTISQLILGHLHLIARNFDKAGAFADKGLKNIENIPFAKAYAYLVRASIYENIDDFKNAQKMYEKCEAFYRESFNGVYSSSFLDGLIEMSRFYAKLGMNKKALALAFEGYNFTQKNSYQNELLKFFQTQNLAIVYFDIKDYNNALKYSNKALSFFDKGRLNMNSLLDSIQNETRKPLSLLIKSKSEYFLKKEQSKSSLDSLLKQTEAALKIVERRKNIIKTHADLETLLYDSNALIDFRKRLFIDLYDKNKDQSHLVNLIELHESSIYSRIRSRLNLKRVNFYNVPEATILRESALKENMFAALNGKEASFESFMESNNEWNIFLDSLKQTFPKYHKMRYASIEEPLDNLHKDIPKNTTVVRYMYVDTTLYGLVLSKSHKELFKLNHKGVSDAISNLAENQSDMESTSNNLYQLYEQLWKPFKSSIDTEHVIIIPDGNLFNLSFESLTPFKINSFKDLKSKSLLSDYSISYNYSLLLIGKNKKPINYEKDFVAFAPEFNDRMKDSYKLAITDSIGLDKTYLSLLPQPFSVDLAKEYSKVFNGDYFINENASKTIFKNEANEHKIIHIGTHAESNNLTPELSRLIFAKNESAEDNSLYTYEIYNENLNSNLAILTACETGKPAYQAGEGMISLAHAFNYAGSESILTSLWKIDEKSSAEILKLFFKYIKRGLPKDKALRQAKLDYISEAEGRTVTPQYWAGLVLIGDTSPIIISGPSKFAWYLISILILITAAIILIIRRNKLRV
ncbi:CHAT domain-containing protein [Hyunsoonleella rubra]|uniref:CHAT domain-containing protein n=1 Tax=Hyunsoonleella rubra TaxID=1737062 RepID=A0ABW5TBH0_9FLAO